MTQHAVLALTGACVLGACAARREAVGDRVSIVLDSSAERRIALRDVVIEPADNVQSARIDARGVIAIERVDQARALRLSAPNLCPVQVPPGPQPDPLELKPVLSLGGDRTGIGFGARFTVQAQLNCGGSGQIHWQQLEGAPLTDLQVTDEGFTLSARTAPFASSLAAASTGANAGQPRHAAHGGEVELSARAHSAPSQARDAARAITTSAHVERAGIVPISPRAQGRVVLEARWEGAGSPSATRQVVISAAARSTGLSSVAVSQSLVLAGGGWSVQTRPPAGHAAVKSLEGLTFFAADAPGSWTLSKHDGSTLKLQALTHDATPYDCGRAECHASLSEHAAESPMSHALERPLAGLADSAAVSCMLDCHVLGERGLSDGGFFAVSARLGFTWTEHTRWQDLPQALRRAGGVRCTACHGPGAIPPPEQRSAILESDVCATCHDAPPRYVHVTQWRASRMASSDRDPATRAPECARCHTTSGFLAHNRVRKLTDEAPRATPTGIACAACHAPHSANRGPRLIRNLDPTTTQTGDLFPEPATTLCRACHAPLTPEGVITSQAPAARAPSSERATSGAQAESVPGDELPTALESEFRASPAAQAESARDGELPTAQESVSRATPPAQAGPAHESDVLTRLKSSMHAAPTAQAGPAPALARDVSTTHEPATHGLAESVSASVAPSGTLFASAVAVPGQDGAGWELVSTRSAHAQVPRGCIGCHGGGALQTGAIDHSFRVEPQVCATCHADDALQAGRAASAELRARALTLSGALAPHCQSSSRPHQQLVAACKDTALQRAVYETNLVLDDNAALFHNADLSRALLDDAARILSAFRGL